MEREVSELDRKLILKRNYLDKIYYHLNKDPIDQDELYIFVRKFFGEYLKLDYEFTYEELSQELNKAFIKPKVKDQIDNFLIRLSESEYLEESKLGTTEINLYLTELNEIIKEIIYEEHSIIPEASIIKKVLNLKGSNDNIFAEINSQIDEAIFHINKGNLDNAKKIYANVMKNYETLSKSDKKSVHDKLNDVYEKIELLSKNPQRVNAENMYKDPEKLKQNSLEKLKKLLVEANSYLEKNNLDLAKSIYVESLKIYESLDKETKKNFSSEILEIYNNLQNNTKFVKNKTVETVKEAVVNNLEIPKSQPEISNAKNETSKIENNNIPNEKIILEEIPAAPIIDNKTIESEVKPINLNAPDNNISGGNLLFSFGSEELKKEDTNSTKKNIDNQVTANNTLIKKDKINTNSTEIKSEEPKKEFDSDENALLNYSIDIDNRMNNLLESNNIDTNILDNNYNTKIKTKKEIATNSKKDTTSTIQTPNIENNNITLINNKNEIPSNNEQTAVDSKNYVLLNTITPIVSESNKKDDTKIAKTSSDKEKTPSLKNTQNIEKIKQLNILLKRTEDDISITKLENAKKFYKESLLIYRTLNDSEKSVCYTNFYNTFKKLDEALHKESLNKIIDQHVEQQQNVQRTVTEKTIVDEEYIPQSLEVLKLTTLPVILDNDPETIRMYELIEESYFNLSNKNTDLAVLKYFKALELYKKLNVEDKKKTYSNLRDLFTKVSLIKKLIKQ